MSQDFDDEFKDIKLIDPAAPEAIGPEAAGARATGHKLRGDADFVRQLSNCRLTTAEILYRLPDHPSILQTYFWQDMDMAPKYPVLKEFLRFWQMKLEGRLYRVRVASTELVKPAEINSRDGELYLN